MSKSKVKKQVTVTSKKVQKTDKLVFPKTILKPIADFLSSRLSILLKRKKEVEKDDPFKDPDRLLDNASPDADAAEQFGHAKTSAIKHELEEKIKQTKRALGRVKAGKYGLCEDCGKLIDTDRLSVYPEATLCTSCAAKREK